MKKVALMQPYLFPYIGYFQLIKAVDLFIAYDDVQWIKGGWINRNRILVDNEVTYITLPVKKDSFRKYINQRVFSETITNEAEAILEQITASYSSAPYFVDAFAVVERILTSNERNAALFIVDSLREICKYLEISNDIILSSNIQKNNNLKSQEKVIEICRSVNASQYINAIGGQHLYKNEAFRDSDIELRFLKPGKIEYKQFSNDYIPNLSIVDVMMFNPVEDINEMLDRYQLL